MEIVRDLMDNRAVLFLFALISLLLGLMVVLTHNLWTGPMLVIIITLIGWAMILRGVMLLFLPHGTIRKIFSAISYEKNYYLIGIVSVIVGAYLTYSGFAF